MERLMREDYLSVARVLNLLAQVCAGVVWGQGGVGRGKCLFCNNFPGAMSPPFYRLLGMRWLRMHRYAQGTCCP